MSKIIEVWLKDNATDDEIKLIRDDVESRFNYIVDRTFDRSFDEEEYELFPRAYKKI